MALRNTIRRRPNRVAGDLAITAIAVLAVAAPGSAALATYRVTTDDTGDVSSYERLRRFNRGELVAVVSDPPENLRAKRRDLEAHGRVLELVSETG
jgi:Gas vesicle synthesis protein GvpO